MQPEINLARCRENLKWATGSFAEMEADVKRHEAEKREQVVRYAGCVKVIPKDERKAA